MLIFAKVWRYLINVMCPRLAVITGAGLLNPRIVKFLRKFSEQVIVEREAKPDIAPTNDVLAIMLKVLNPRTFL